MSIFDQSTISHIDSLLQKHSGKTIVFTASAFDVFHCGHVLMLKDAKNQGDVVIAALQTNPNLDRPTKNIPIQQYEERLIQIEGCKYVDEIIKYATEEDLVQILKQLKPHIRVLGTDWKGKHFTGDDLPIKIHWHERTHDWSTTYLRERIYNNEAKKREN